MATVSGQIPDPMEPKTSSGLPADSAIHLVHPIEPSRTSGNLSNVTTWWRTDQTRWIHKEFLTTDIVCLVLSSSAAVYSYLAADHWRHRSLLETGSAKTQSALLLLMTVLVVLFCQNYGLYRARRTRTYAEEAKIVAKSLLFSSLLLIGFALLSGVRPIMWDTMILALTLQFATMLGWRYHEFNRTERRMSDGVGTRNVLIVGAGVLGRNIAQSLERERHLGYVVKGFVDNNPNGTQVLGKIEDIAQLARAHFVDEIVIALPWDSELAAKAAIEGRRHRLNVKLVPHFYGGQGWRAPLEYMGDVPAFALHREPIPAMALLVKRSIDLIVSAVGLVALAPLFGIIAIAIALDSPGPTFYRSYRVGKKGRHFLFFKFRTMVVNADALKDELRKFNERKGPFFKMANDPRMTRVGKWLRRYSLDELPQLWNVLKGDMSLVGPRPHPLDDFQQYSLDHLRRLDVMPGMTGLWQVQARDESSWETNMNLDLEYIEHWTPWLDVKLIMQTIPIVLNGLGQ